MAPHEHSAADEPAKVGVLHDMWRTKLWRMIPMFFIYITCITTMLPVKPNLMTNFFASRHMRHYIHCEDYSVQKAPQACSDAHATVVLWASWSDFITNSIVLFLLAPMVGRWSDAYGRKPFLVICYSFACLPVLILTLHMQYGLSLYFYFPASVINGAFSSVSIAMSAIADVIQPHNRAPAFGCTMASFSVGIMVGPTLGGHLTPLQCGWLAAGGVMACILYVLLLLPETLTVESKQQARTRLLSRKRPQGKYWKAPDWHGLTILTRNPLFLKLTLVLMLNGIVSEGLWEIMTQYLQLKLGFNTLDNSHLFSLAGLIGLFNNTIGMRALVAGLGETNMMRFGILVYAAEMVMLALAPTKQWAIGAICFGMFGNVIFPAIATIKSNNVAASEQGTVQGALYGARALAQGVGPLGFSYMFFFFSRSRSGNPFLPGIPFLLGAVLMLVTFGLSMTIDRNAADHGRYKEHAEAKAEAATEPLLPQDEEAAAAAEHKLDEEHAMDNECMPPGPGLIMGIAPHAEEMPISIHHEEQGSLLHGRSSGSHHGPEGHEHVGNGADEPDLAAAASRNTSAGPS